MFFWYVSEKLLQTFCSEKIHFFLLYLLDPFFSYGMTIFIVALYWGTKMYCFALRHKKSFFSIQDFVNWCINVFFSLPENYTQFINTCFSMKSLKLLQQTNLEIYFWELNLKNVAPVTTLCNKLHVQIKISSFDSFESDYKFLQLFFLTRWFLPSCPVSTLWDSYVSSNSDNIIFLFHICQ